jgi:hypothetical protein
MIPGFRPTNAVRRRFAQLTHDVLAAIVMVLLVADVIVAAAILQALKGP